MDVINFLMERGSHNHSHVSHWANGTHMNATHMAMHETSAERQHIGHNMLAAWIVLQLAGQISLPILIVTLLFHKRIARRNPTVINLCIVWTLATIPPELLFYTGNYKPGGEQPSPMLCLLQAATISGVPPMASTAYLAVVIHACTVVYEIMNSATRRPFAIDLRLILLLSSPYIAFFTFSIFIAIVGAQHPEDVKRRLFFCEVVNHGVSVPVFSYAVLIVIITLILQIWVGIMVYRNCRANRKESRRGNGTNAGTAPESVIDIPLLIRLVAFTLFEIVIVVSSLTTMFSPGMAASKLLIATPPFAVFLIFSGSPDILQAWFPCFRRKNSNVEIVDEKQGPVERHEPNDRERPLPPLPPRPPSREDDALHPTSPLSVYTQESIAPPPPVKTKRPLSTRQGQDIDLEKGYTPQLRVDDLIHAWPGPSGGHDPPDAQEHRTMIVVHRSSTDHPESPLDTIRTLRAPMGGGRTKPRWNHF